MSHRATLTRWRLAIGSAALLSAVPANAHGQEVLTSIYAQIASVAVVVFLLLRVRVLRRHWPAGLLGCIIGVAASWWMTADMPYTKNEDLIITLGIAGPVLLSALCVLAAFRLAKSRARP